MKLYVVRHGRTNCNDKQVFNGRYDEDINETGKKQVQILKEKIKHLKFDVIISSSMKRAVSTAEILNVHDVPIVLNDHFIERNVGDLTLQKTSSPDYLEYTSWYATKYVGLETISQIMERVFKGLDELKIKYEGKTILLVTHASVTRCINAYFHGLHKNSYQNEEALKNCEIKEYEF